MSSKKTKLVTTALFPPIQYYAHIAFEEKILIEVNCNYERRTYRNRYLINSPNGILPLSVPVVKYSGKKVKTKDVEISYNTPWNEIHWKSITAAYNSSPYFQYYKDDLLPLFTKRWKLLAELNSEALKIVNEAIDSDTVAHHTKEFIPGKNSFCDMRSLIYPKKSVAKKISFTPQPYRQLFKGAENFIPNLSILDLLFNKGPESLLILRDSITKTDN
ncbi:WbqC family protein [Marinilabiliaceae bacterium ANBcel2]|nr:WbqC family protein [Marinilabiliaceae bacterium ANBcel2]